MDGLSVAASIAGLLSIADIVVREGYKYIRDVKDAEKSVTKLIGEVNKLSGIIHSLENVARQCEEQKYKIEPTTQVHEIEACLKTLRAIETHLKESDPATATDNSDKIKRKLKWTFNKSKVKEFMLEVEKHQNAMRLAMTASEMSSLLQLLDGHHVVHDTLVELKKNIEEDRVERAKITMTDQRKKWFQALGHVEAQRWQDSNIKLRQPGTGVWFTDGPEFKDWLTTDSGRLWVHGIPGAGKTILMATVIQEAQKYTSQSRALVFFYCDYKDPSTQNPVNIIGSLAKQLAMQSPEPCFKIIEEWYTALESPSYGTLSVDADNIYGLMKRLSAQFTNIMIIVDGLDEISIDRANVTDMLQGLNVPCGNIKTLFASRNEIDLQHPLRKYRQLSIAARSSDLRLYVTSEIEMRIRNQQMRIQDPDLKTHIMETLVDKVQGMFRWVTCQVDYLCECTNDRERREALSKLPPDLPRSYERILERVNNNKNKANRLLVIRTLQLICYTSRPLGTKALLEALAVKHGDTDLDPQSISTEDEILSLCSSLVRKRLASGLEFTHFTVKEFLVAIDPMQSPQIFQYQMNEKAHFEIARNCLTYLNAKTFSAFSITPENASQLVENHPFIAYAIFFWNHHAFEFGEDNSVLELAYRLFSPDVSGQFLLYITIMSQREYHKILDLEYKDQTPENCLIEITEGDFDGSTYDLPIPNSLHWAAALGIPRVCSWLIKQKQDINHITVEGSPLSRAVGGVHVATCFIEPDEYIDVFPKCRLRRETVQVLLKAGAKTEITPPEDSDFSPIFIAIQTSDTQICDDLVAAGAQIQAKTLVYLRIAISNDNSNFAEGWHDMVDWLAVQSISSIATDAYGELFSLLLAWITWYDWDVEFDDISVIFAIPPPKENPQEWIHKSLLDGFEENNIAHQIAPLYKNLLVHGERLLTHNCLVAVLKKLLLEAVQGCNCKFLSAMVDGLESYSVDLSDILSKLDIKEVLLQIAIQVKEEDADRNQNIQYLIKCGQDVREQDSQGATSFHIAARIGDMKTLELLWQAIQEPEALLIRDNEGRTAQDYAASSESSAIVDFISQKCGFQHYNGVYQETLQRSPEIFEQNLPLRELHGDIQAAMEREFAPQSDIEMNDVEVPTPESARLSPSSIRNSSHPTIYFPKAVVYKLVPLSDDEITVFNQKLFTFLETPKNEDSEPAYVAWQVKHSLSGDIYHEQYQSFDILNSGATLLHRGIVESEDVYSGAD